MNTCLICNPDQKNQFEATSFCYNCLSVKVGSQRVQYYQLNDDEHLEYSLLTAVKELEPCMICYKLITVETRCCKICNVLFENFSCHEDKNTCKQCLSRGFHFLSK